MTDADIQEWQERHTFECPRLRAKISPAQCAANRARVAHKGSFLGDMVFIRPRACEDCTEYIKLAATVQDKGVGLCAA